MILETLPQAKVQIKRLDLKVGFSCINDCRFCVAADKRTYPDKTTEQIKQELEEAYANRARQVVFTGGECTIREDIFEIVKFARDLGYYSVQIQTNGRKFASPEFCKKMLLAGMNEVSPALHGHSAELHDFLTKRKGSFRQTVLGIYNLKRITKGQLRIITNTVVTKFNYKFLPEIASLLIKLGVYQYQFAFVHALGNAGIYFQDIVPKKTDVVPYMIKGLEMGIAKGVNVMIEAIPLCLLKGYEKYAAEFYIPSTELREKGEIIERFEEVRRNKGKIKFTQCRICNYHEICEGPWREYSQFYGDEEFKPVTA